MVKAAIGAVIPNPSPLGEAIAGSSAVIFTATDREIIKQRAGEINRERSFKEVFAQKNLTPEVENEETTIKPEPDAKALENRLKVYRRMLKHAPLHLPRERVEIQGEAETEIKAAATEEVISLTPSPQTTPPPKISEETASLVRELNLNPAEIFDKFTLEQKELYHLICRIKDLHLRRLLCSTRDEFRKLSHHIKGETLAAGKPEAQAWLEAQLDKLTLNAAEYKLGLLKSLQAMEFNPHHEKNMQWLKKIVASPPQS